MAKNYTHRGSMRIANLVAGKNPGKLFAEISPNVIAGNIGSFLGQKVNKSQAKSPVISHKKSQVIFYWSCIDITRFHII